MFAITCALMSGGEVLSHSSSHPATIFDDPLPSDEDIVDALWRRRGVREGRIVCERVRVQQDEICDITLFHSPSSLEAEGLRR